MKRFLIALITFFILSLGNPLSAKNSSHKMMKNQWVCSTNASSSSNSAEKKADDMMQKAKSGHDAFNFALKHCRDCTKITCDLQTTSNQTTQPTNQYQNTNTNMNPTNQSTTTTQ